MKNDFGLYVIITKPFLSCTRIAEICVRHKIRYLQLREKDLTDRELLSMARDILSITRGSETEFVINDRADLAHIMKCSLHLGQEDIPIDLAREILGAQASIGLSTHSLAQASQALLKDPDYIGFGPVYPTPTKAKPDPTVGLENLRQAVQLTNTPVVAIGGINETNIDQVLDTGAKNLSVVRYLMQTTDFENRLLFLQEKCLERKSNDSI